MTKPESNPLIAAHSSRNARQWEAAVALYQEVVSRHPQEIDAWVGLALCYEELGDLPAACQALLACLAHRPETAFAHHRLGWLSFQQRCFTDALSHYLQAIRYAPNWVNPHYHAALCCQELRLYPDAIAHFQNAVRCKADLPNVWYHAAKALKDGGWLDVALPVYQKALELQPDYSEARYSLGLLHLLRGDWLAGWDGYELRWQGSDRAATEHRPATTLPLWQGEDVPPDSGVVVYAEQGKGDSVMCFRYAGLLRERFARVKFAETAPLVTLFQHSAPEGVEVVARIRRAIDETGYTHYIHTLSLPAAFKTTPETVPAAPYLQAPPERKRYWQQRLDTEPRPKVGLVWRGGKLSYAPGRDMAFHHLVPLLNLDGICWFSLQKDDAPPIDSPVIDWMNEVGDFADTAALVASLDLIISVDTAVAHLAGALGKPVWLLNRYESEWRWMRGKDTSPWYPSMRIFNQGAPGDWDGVITQVGAIIHYNFFPNYHRGEKRHMRTFLHVGCGPKRKDQTTRGFNAPEWNELRLDIDENVSPDIVGTMLDMSAVTDASVDAVFSSHNIEHLYAHEVPLALKEFLRVLKLDGFLVVTCPDLQSVCALIAEDKLTEPAYTAPAGPITPLDILYGHRPPIAKGNLYMAHRCGFTEKVLIGTLQASGFASIASKRRGHPHFDLYAVATAAPMEEAQLRQLAAAHLPQ